ncbi:hypothetical protein VTL71DRAFT_3932 [Oculimacula yallundae]|uniref:Ankyrin n=1 Tax=Oculimacula yallundae TaxID=86028 RepID=A0ABR4C4D1_9HELO
MELLDLPPEIVAKLMEAAIVIKGLGEALVLRLVCSAYIAKHLISEITTAKVVESEFILASTLVDVYRHHFSPKAVDTTIAYTIQRLPELSLQTHDELPFLSLAVVRQSPVGGFRPVRGLWNPENKASWGLPEHFMSIYEEIAVAATAYLDIKSLFLRILEHGSKHALTTPVYRSCIAVERYDIDMDSISLDDKLPSLSCPRTSVWKSVLWPRTLFLAPWQVAQPTSEYLLNYILRQASEYGHEKLVLMALNNGADVNTSQGGHYLGRELAGTRGAMVSQDPSRTSRPLMAAVKGGWVNIARLLIDPGAVFDPEESVMGTTKYVRENSHEYCIEAIPLFIAIDHGQLDCVRLLLEAGSNINPYPNVGKEACLHAKSNGYASIMRLLVEYGLEDVQLSVVISTCDQDLHVQIKRNMSPQTTGILGRNSRGTRNVEIEAQLLHRIEVEEATDVIHDEERSAKRNFIENLPMTMLYDVAAPDSLNLINTNHFWKVNLAFEVMNRNHHPNHVGQTLLDSSSDRPSTD